MKHKIPCFCDNTIEVEAPQEINLSKDPHYIDDILSGKFFNFPCAVCGKLHKPEFPINIVWAEKNLDLEVLGELDRGKFYRRLDEKNQRPRETVISYPEMAERITMIKDDLVAEAVESIKYYLFMKADESYPENDINVWYNGKTQNDLEFHVHGIKDDEVAITRIPISLYEKTLNDFRSNPKSEPFPSLRVKTYCSIQNMLRPDELK